MYGPRHLRHPEPGSIDAPFVRLDDGFEEFFRETESSEPVDECLGRVSTPPGLHQPPVSLRNAQDHIDTDQHRAVL